MLGRLASRRQIWPPGTDPDNRDVFDPAWLRSSFVRCLWDGRSRLAGHDFCSGECEEAYEDWMASQARSIEVAFEFPEGHFGREEMVIPVRPRKRTSQVRKVISDRPSV